uniref:Reverse transcriptase zinc-binding domain-containing protein n=1 Tax=Cannabis sativa TaxID=3483 RepID=A0A803QJ62_CANSA
MWKHFWKLKILPKVLNFAWRALTGCLATRVQLQIKHVFVDLHCLLCNGAAKTAHRLLVECLFSQYCWTRFAIALPPLTTVNFQDWFVDFWSRHKGNVVEEVLMDFWTKYDEGIIKINVDGATFEAKNAYGTGLIARDSNGVVIMYQIYFTLGC